MQVSLHRFCPHAQYALWNDTCTVQIETQFIYHMKGYPFSCYVDSIQELEPACLRGALRI